MGIFGGTAPPSCPSSRHCAEWARIYLKYCLCSPKDGVALTLGLLSVISWGVAEVPQIITNYRQKSTEGLSIAFLMTWIVGDLFNLVGCFLEPATVPWMSLLLAVCVLHFLVGNTHMEVPSGTVIPIGRRLLMFTDDLGQSSLSHGSGSGIGSFLGWAMAIIYMGGRLPQIFLNGLNPLMFTFALLGNSTYVGRKVSLNTLAQIILQFLYFHYRKRREPTDEHDNADKA
ncbi:hypothetical protein PR202_ga23958 [Eleusine coracana subsp. coracana]|uniref:Uncharacterized protein n=1 Tax=Eleusine coracana subsp. coracana TaxID=191504 RepID=A0AAV5D6G8_ELECO|nr:hypothetical protein PR202_ga23958 [Eleusine coracana subsp. coracana]